jgi:precorrin-6Y C5,15-methyltransferase (decarboxylating)
MKKIYLVGIGMGNAETLTEQGRKAVASSALLIGAERIVKAFPEYTGEICCAITPSAIMDYIALHPEHEQIAVIFSGDVGFYSGAKKLNLSIEEKQQSESGQGFWSGFTVEFIPGISSLQYFCARLKRSWEDARIVSLHGRENNAAGAVRNHEKTFFLTGGDYPVQRVCRILSENDMGEATVFVGERLSYPDEKITSGTADQLADGNYDSLAVMLVENKNTLRREVTTHGLRDELFQRGQVPMTKSEIRSISLSKLQLRPGDVVYDIGAGTGSVTVDMALQVREGCVFAIECNEEAVGLIRENRENFGAWNIKIIPGMAPEAMVDLPVPDRAFIGGSKGNLNEIISLLLEKNPGIRIVINAITLETMAEAIGLLKQLGFGDIDIVQVFAAHGKAAGSYHMMLGQNPVFIISGEINRQ